MPHIDLTLHSHDTAPDASRSALAAARTAFGFVPNLVAVMAESPALAHAYMDVHRELTDHCSLTASELQVVYLATSHTNACPYCMAAHSGIGQLVGLTAEEIQALRDGASLPDRRLEALRTFAVAMVRDRGHVSDETLSAFLGAGFGKRAILDVIAGIAFKTMSNYTDHLANTPLDGPLKKWSWAPESAAAR